MITEKRSRHVAVLNTENTSVVSIVFYVTIDWTLPVHRHVSR